MLFMSNEGPLKVVLKMTTHKVWGYGGCSKASQGTLAVPVSWAAHTAVPIAVRRLFIMKH